MQRHLCQTCKAIFVLTAGLQMDSELKLTAKAAPLSICRIVTISSHRVLA